MDTNLNNKNKSAKVLNYELITIDKLNLNFSGVIDEISEDIIVNNDLTLQYLGRTKIFNTRFKAIYKSKEVAQILCNPISKAIQQDLIQIELNNTLFYSNDWRNITNYLKDQLCLSFRGISKIDIAADGFELLDPIREYFNNKVVFAGNVQDIKAMFDKQANCNYFAIGSRSSDKFIRGYIKTDEIKESSNKTYILDYFKKNNLDIEKPIHRIEVSIKSNYLNKMYGKINDTILRPHYKDFAHYFVFECKEQMTDILVNLFSICTNESMRMIKREDLEQKKRTNLCKTAYLWNFKRKTIRFIERAKIRASNELYKLKMTAKTMFFVWQQTGSKVYLDICQNVVDNIQNPKWFENKVDKWQKEYDLYYKNFEFIPIWETA